MITLEISDEQLQKALDSTLEKLFASDNYNNPIAKIVEKAVGSSYSKGALTEVIEEKIVSKLNKFMETDKFDLLLGQEVAKAIAAREVKKDKMR